MTEQTGFPPEDPAPVEAPTPGPAPVEDPAPDPAPVEDPAPVDDSAPDPAPVRPPDPAWMIDVRANAPGWLSAALVDLQHRLGDLEHGG
jgi:hypothetical protein